MANGIRIYYNWCNALHEMEQDSPSKARDLAFRIIDYGATGVLNIEGLSAIDKDWLITVSKGIDETNQKARGNGDGEAKQGRPTKDIDDQVQALLDSGVTNGTKIAEILHVSKDKVYSTTPWKDYRVSLKAAKEGGSEKETVAKEQSRPVFNF